MLLSTRYDVLNTAIFLPSGGSRRVRQRFVDVLEIEPGHRVLELGCGTGQVTALLVAAGADVVAIDALPGMLDGARRRAPDATIVEGDIFDRELTGEFDRVVLSFVLHNFDADGRTEALRRSAQLLAPTGFVGILDWAIPSGRIKPLLWRRFLTRLEPSVPDAPLDAELQHLGGVAPNVTGVLDGGLDADIEAAGLRLHDRRPSAGGRAQILLAGRCVPPSGDGGARGTHRDHHRRG